MRICSLELPDSPLSIEVGASRSLKPHNTPVVTLATDRTDSLLATGSADGSIKVWDIRGAYVTHTFHGSGSVVTSLVFFEVNTKKQMKSSVEYRLAAGYDDGQIRIWDLEKRKSAANLQAHGSLIRTLDIDKDNSTLVSASSDKTIVLWSVSKWNQLNTITALEDVHVARFLDSKSLVTGGENGRLRIWNVPEGKEVCYGEDVASAATVQAMICPSTKWILSVYEDFTMQLYSFEHLDALKKTGGSLPLKKRISGTHDEVIDFVIVGQRKDHLAVATNVEEVKVLSLQTNEAIGETQDPTYFGSDVGILKGHQDIVICLDVDWSGAWIVSGAKDNTARLWCVDPETDTYSCVAVLTGHAESVGAIALPKATPPLDSSAYQNPLQNPPKFVLSGSQDKTIKHWSITSTSPEQHYSSRATYTRKAHDKDINSIDVNHNSTLFASASQDRSVKIWSTVDGEVTGILRGHRRGVWSVKFAPKGTGPISIEGNKANSTYGYVLTGSGDKTVKIWSLSDYNCLRTFEGHTNSVLKVAWMVHLPENRQGDTEPIGDEDIVVTKAPELRKTVKVASAAGDGLVKVWDVGSEELAATLDSHVDRVWALLVQPASNAIFSGGGDGVITRWKDMTSSQVAAQAAASTARIEEDQRLQNFMRAGSYREAITLALQLNHPARLLSLFTAVVGTYPQEKGSLCGVKAVDDVLIHLSDEQLLALLGRLRDWNTNAKTAPVAQRLFWVILKSYPPARLLSLGRGKGSDIKEVLDAFRVYTQRHYTRMEELIDESYLVNYTLQEMDQMTDSTAVLAEAVPPNGIKAT